MAHNFFIGDLGFHKVINDDHPYERATAPFRKEQFDAAPTVGDQSLSGWWTRGQLSFHKGAGVKYYEVLEGSAVLDRFYLNYNTDTTVPGEVTIAPLLQEGPVANVKDMATVQVLGTKYLVALTSDGTTHEVKYWLEGDITTASPTTVATHQASHLAAGSGAAYYIDQTGTSIYKWNAGASSTSLLWSGPQFRFVGYGKSRLWAIDNVGYVYMLDTSTGGTVSSSTDSFGQLTGVPYPHLYEEDAPGVTFAASPSDVYFGIGRRVWRVNVDQSGSVPAPTAPVETVILPEGEQIKSLGFEMGMLVIGTTAGARFGAQQSDGSVVYGPPVGPSPTRSMQANFGRRVAAVGTKVLLGGAWYVEDVSGKSGSVYGGALAFDVANPVDDNGLQPAWSHAFNVPTSDPFGLFGILATDYGILYWNLGAVVYRTRENVNQGVLNSIWYATEGYVQTGLHRFGTLDEKHFQSIVVRGSGTIEVSKVSPTGTVTSLGEVTLTSGEEGAFDLGETSPLESVGFRFTLKKTGSTTAVLHGYQVKALPSPKRQRLIRVPLMMFDTERGPTGRAIGAEKSAWTRYQALESLEETDALVTYEDRDTGETGTAYIESVELIQRNGSKGVSRSNGFGGVVSITLRKVS